MSTPFGGDDDLLKGGVIEVFGRESQRMKNRGTIAKEVGVGDPAEETITPRSMKWITP